MTAPTTTIWRVAPDGTTSAMSPQELGEPVGVEMATPEEQSGGRTISPEWFGLPSIEAMDDARQRAWEQVVTTGRLPRAGRPSKASRAAGVPRLADLGLTKQQLWRMRELGRVMAIDPDGVAQRIATQRQTGRFG